MKVTPTHIGALSMGRLLAIWTFVIGMIMLLGSILIILVMTLLGVTMSETPVQMFGGGLLGMVIAFVSGMVGICITGLIAFVIGVIAATVYNIILGVGGGIDLDLDERQIR